MEAQWDSTDFSVFRIFVKAGGLDNGQLVKQGQHFGEELGAIRQLFSANIGKQLGLNIPLELALELTSSKVLNPFKEQLFKTMNLGLFNSVINLHRRIEKNLVKLWESSTFLKGTCTQKNLSQVYFSFTRGVSNSIDTK